MAASSKLAIGAGCAAGVVVIFVLYKKLTRTALDAAVEGASPLKKAGKKAMLANRAAKQFAAAGKVEEGRKRDTNASRMSRASTDGFHSFVSHMKAEAAMEARFLQLELERLTDEMVFLDSDDLRNLKLLVDHVKASRALLLLQTRKVLTRPYCVLEILTAIEHNIPIVGVTVAGRPNDAYDFEEMSQFMMWFDTELEEYNAGAADVLRDNGYDDLTEVAYQLSSIIPKAISVSLNTCASRNMLRATIEDIVATTESARADIDDRMKNVPSKAEWLAARAKMTKPTSKAKAAAAAAAEASQVHQHGSPPPAATAAAASAPVKAVAGRALFEAAKVTPALLPIAFAVQGMASGGKGAKFEVGMCQRLSVAAGPLERLLTSLEGGALDPAALHGLANVLENAVALQARCGPSAKASPLEADGAGAFDAVTASLIESVSQLDVAGSSKGRAAAMDFAKALQGIPIAPPAEEAAAAAVPAAEGASAAMLAEQQAQAEAARQQRELLEMQNKVLMEQVEQMQKMMAAQQMSMQTFMAKFPQPPDEAERRLVLMKRKLMEHPLPCTRIDEVCRNVLESNMLGEHCRALMITIIGADQQRMIATCFRLVEDPSILKDTSDLPPAMLDGMLVSRKMTACQYVVASGEMQCFARQSGNKPKAAGGADAKPGSLDAALAAEAAAAEGPRKIDLSNIGLGDSEECFAVKMFKVGVEAISADFPELLKADPTVKETVGQQANGLMWSFAATDEMMEKLPPTRRLASRVAKAGMSGLLGNIPGGVGDFMKFFGQVFGADDLVYLGAPIYADGHAMGSCCGFYTGMGPEGPDETIKAKQQRAADRISQILEEL